MLSYSTSSAWAVAQAVDTGNARVALGSDLPLDLERIIGRCLEKKPRERFKTALDVANELRGLKTTLAPTGPSLHVPQDRPSIAVLPFENLSGDREQEYFADGIVAEITSRDLLGPIGPAQTGSTGNTEGRSNDLAARMAGTMLRSSVAAVVTVTSRVRQGTGSPDPQTSGFPRWKLTGY